LPPCDDTVPKWDYCPDGRDPTPAACITANYPDSESCNDADTDKKYENYFTYVSDPGGETLAAPSGNEVNCWCEVQCYWSINDCLKGTECNEGTIRQRGTYYAPACRVPGGEG